MQVTETSSEGLKHEFTVVIGADEISDKMAAKLEVLKDQVRLPGFRPGKVPVDLLRKRYGPSVMGEVLEETVNTSVQQALAERELHPAIKPNIEITKFEDGSDLEFKLSVEVVPEIEPMDFSKLEVERLKVEITDEDVNEVLQRLADRQKSFSPVARNRKAKPGDAVLIDFVGKIDGETFEGGSGTDFQLELGSGSFIPGFEDQIIGAKGGDHVEVKVNFPADYGAAELAGKEAVFEVDVKEVQEAQPAAIDDELATKVGMETLDSLKEAVKAQIQQENDGLARARLKRALLDALEEGHDFEVPPGMVEAEFEGIWQQVEEQRKKGEDDDEAEVEDAGKSDDELKTEYRAIAERRVRLGLLLSEVGQRNNIDVQEDEVKRALMERARSFPGHERQVLEYYQQQPEAMNELRAPIYEDKVVDFITEIAKVTERTVTREELLAEPEEDQSEGAKKATGGKAEEKATGKAKPAKPAKKKATAKKDDSAKE